MGLQENLAIFLFIDDLIAITDGNEFENHYNEIYPSEEILKKEKHFTHTDYFSRPSSLYKRGSNSNILI